MTRLVAFVLVLTGLLLGGWGVRALGEIVHGDVAGSLAVLAATPAPEAQAAPLAARAPQVPAPAVTVAAIPTSSARIGDLDSTERAVPTRLRIPSLGLEAPVDEVGVLDDGALQIPEDVTRVGWYRFGSAPGDAAGSTVLTGHVDSRRQGAGAFFELRDVEPGEQIEIELSDGAAVLYEVVGRERIDKDALPTDDVFRRSGPPVLTLITCGGSFDAAARSYADNIVVVAQPLS